MTPDINAKVGRLEKGVTILADDVVALTDQVVVERNWRRRFTYAAVVVGSCVVALVVVLIWLAAGNRSLLRKFDECTNPGTKTHPHACYDKGQAQTAKAIATLQQVSIRASAYVGECIIAGRADVEQCVEQRFAGAPPPAPVIAAEASNATTSTTTTTITTPRAPTTTTSARGLPQSASLAAPSPAVVTLPPSPPPDMTAPPPVDPCRIDLKVFCLGTGTSTGCPSATGLCLPTVNPKGV